MRKNQILFLLVVFILLLAGCSKKKSPVDVYENTEEFSTDHELRTVAAVVTGIDLQHNIISFIECTSGVQTNLMYHGGVSVRNRYGEEIGINKIALGSVVDVEYYTDTAKLLSIQISDTVTTLTGVTKFVADVESGKATYKGTSCDMSKSVVAFDGDKQIDITEIHTEDQVTLFIFGGKLVAASIEVGHGYVRLSGQDSYIGGLVEIGYDVIVPVTDDMLLAVREGEYTLRISNNGYSDSKEIKVVRDKETKVDLTDIAIPTGTIGFTVTPEDATIKVGKKQISGFVYSNLYGTYTFTVEAEGYKTFRGSFKIDKPSKNLTIELVKLEEEPTTEEPTTEATTETTTEATTEGTTSETESTTEAESTGQSSTSTEREVSEGHTITIKEPAGVGVYFDGDYVGTAPVSVPKTLGTHTITLYQSGYLIKSYTITAVENGENDEYSYPALTSFLDLIE